MTNNLEMIQQFVFETICLHSWLMIKIRQEQKMDTQKKKKCRSIACEKEAATTIV